MKEESLKNRVFDILRQKDFIFYEQLDDYSKEILKTDKLYTFNKKFLKRYLKESDYKDIQEKVINFIVYLNEEPDVDYMWLLNNRYDYIWNLI